MAEINQRAGDFIQVPRELYQQMRKTSTGNTITNFFEALASKVNDLTKEVYITDPETGKQANVESNGGLAVNIQDQHSPVLDIYMHRHLGSVTLANNLAIGDYSFDFVAGHGASAGEVLCLKENGRYYQGTITNVAVDTITVDTPVDYAYTVAGSCSRTEHDMASAAGTQASPQIYHVAPTGLFNEWDIVRVIFHIEASTAMDDGKFGNLAALTNGIVLRKKDGEYKNIFNVKTNGEFAERAYDREYVNKPPAGTGHAMNVRRTFAGPSKNGVTIRLDPEAGDELQILVQDDLTGLDHFHCVVQGHRVTE